MAEPTGADRQVKLGRIVGLVFCVGGFTAILLGYNGMSYKACVDCQLPYIVSGGILGTGLVIFGVSLLMAASNRAERLALERKLDELNRALTLMGAAVELQAHDASPNGKVVAGRSTYHRPDCRLVKGREDLDFMTPRAAEASGLSACRVCRPETADV